MWGDLWGSKQGAADLEDAGTCSQETKNFELLTQIILTPPPCDQSAPCPCGSTCSSTIAGVCVVDCRDSTECAPGKTCSIYGQCLGSGGADGGVPENPACPRDFTLLTSAATLERQCKFNDECPHGARCDIASGRCVVGCMYDGMCEPLNGHARVCSCLGQCVVPDGPVEKPAASQPKIVVTPSSFLLPPASDPPPATPAWGPVNEREFSVSLTRTILVGSSASPPVVVTPGTNVEVLCPDPPAPGETPEFSASPCSVALGDFTSAGGSYATASKTVKFRPVATTAPTPPAVRWEVRVGAQGASNAPQIVTAEYAADPLSIATPAVASHWEESETPPTSFQGAGYVQLKTATGEMIKLPVSGRTDSAWHFVLNDAARLLSTSGKVMLHDPRPLAQSLDAADRNDWYSFESTTHFNALTGVVSSFIADQSYRARVRDQGGAVDELEIKFNLYFRTLNVENSGYRTDAIPVVVHLTATTRPGIFCGAGNSCPSNLTCDLGFCGLDTAVVTTVPDLGVPVIGKSGTRDTGGLVGPWRLILTPATAPDFRAQTTFCGQSEGNGAVQGAVFGQGINPFSGDSQCFDYQQTTNIGPVPSVAPLLGHRDLEKSEGRAVLDASQLLKACYNDLAQQDPIAFDGDRGFLGLHSGESGDEDPPPVEYRRVLRDCISIGQWTTAAASARQAGWTTLHHRLLQQWLEVHAFVAREGLQEDELSNVLAASGTPVSESSMASVAPALADSPGLTYLANEMEVGWGWLYREFSEFRSLGIVDPDYRNSPRGNQDTTCDHDDDCATGSYCDLNLQRCQYPGISSTPEHQQTVGLPTTILQAMTAHLDVVTRMTRVASQRASFDSAGVAVRNQALARVGRTLRLAVLAESIAKTIEDDLASTSPTDPGTCPRCKAADWQKQWAAAVTEFQTARQILVAAFQEVASGPEPPNDDNVPLFFGDPTGTNSRYFASSDYLLDGWAAPAVSAAQSSLGAARDAWISRALGVVQDTNAANDRAKALEDLKTSYGTQIIANCGPISVAGGPTVSASEVLETLDRIKGDQERRIDLDTCHIQKSCIGLDDVTNSSIRQRIIAEKFRDNEAKSQLCKLSEFAKDVKLPYLVPHATPGEAYTDDIACFFSEAYPVKKTTIPCEHRRVTLPNGMTDLLQCNPLTPKSNCEYEDCLYPRHFVSGYPVGSIGYNGRMLSWSDFMPVDEFEVDPWAYAKYEAPDANGVAHVVTEIARQNTGLKCRIPVDYLYGNTPPEWGPHQRPEDVDGAAWVDAYTDCASGSRIKEQPMNLNERYLFRDYPLPMPQLAASCFSGEMGQAQMNIQDAIYGLDRVRADVAAATGNLRDQVDHCVNIANWNQQAAAKAKSHSFWSNMTQVGMLAGTLALTAASGGAAAPAAGMVIAGVVMGSVNISGGGGGPSTGNQMAGQAISGIGNLVQSNLDADLKAFEDMIAEKKEVETCYLAQRQKLRDMAHFPIDIQIALNTIDINRGRMKIYKALNEQTLRDGLAKIDAEKNRKWGSYAHSYWYDEKVERFKRDFEWSRRLTYLAMLAIEYEFQQSLPFRSDIRGAVSPDQLEVVIRGLKQEQGTRSLNRRRPEESSVVVSLRDDILQIPDRSQDPGAGERAWTPAQRFQGRLDNAAYSYFGKDGAYLGQAVPFVLAPQGILESRCGERLWRVTATIQGDGLSEESPNASLLLLKRNTFSSQWCAGGDVVRSGVQSASIFPSEQLLKPGVKPGLSEPQEFTAALMTPWFNIRRTDFYKDSYQDGSSEELAGRGLYGDYVLLFPKQLLDKGFALSKVEDVLLRIDYLSVDNLSQ